MCGCMNGRINEWIEVLILSFFLSLHGGSLVRRLVGSCVRSFVGVLVDGWSFVRTGIRRP